MSRYDIGLWFKCWDDNENIHWLKDIPPCTFGTHYLIKIYFNKVFVGTWSNKNYSLSLRKFSLFQIKLNKYFPQDNEGVFYIGRKLSPQDFEITFNYL